MQHIRGERADAWHDCNSATLVKQAMDAARRPMAAAQPRGQSVGARCLAPLAPMVGAASLHRRMKRRIGALTRSIPLTIDQNGRYSSGHAKRGTR